MGGYDTVTTSCPKCGYRVEFQSKARNCDFEGFARVEVPVSIAEDLDGKTVECVQCLRPVTLSMQKEVKTVAMEVT